MYSVENAKEALAYLNALIDERVKVLKHEAAFNEKFMAALAAVAKALAAVSDELEQTGKLTA